jgi:DnaJ-class molecular chaperone
MVQQISMRCSNCNGSGHATPANDTCPACKGKCLISEKKQFEVRHCRQGGMVGCEGEGSNGECLVSKMQQF